MPESLKLLLEEVHGCSACGDSLPLGPRPVVQVGRRARLVIVGQAPGTRVHESGVPWDDDSGDHLRSWLAIEKQAFYDRQRVAILPMGFCYPGRKGGGDAPPRPECAPLWHARLLDQVRRNEPLILLVGQYAQKYYLGAARKKTLTETVRAFKPFLPGFFPLPHPSWRSKLWMKKNAWFEADVLPELRQRVRSAMTA